MSTPLAKLNITLALNEDGTLDKSFDYTKGISQQLLKRFLFELHFMHEHILITHTDQYHDQATQLAAPHECTSQARADT